MIAEVALAVMIAVGAALLARSVGNLYAVDPGVRTEGVAVVDVMLGRLNRARSEQTLDELTTALAATARRALGGRGADAAAARRRVQPAAPR